MIKFLYQENKIMYHYPSIPIQTNRRHNLTNFHYTITDYLNFITGHF